MGWQRHGSRSTYSVEKTPHEKTKIHGLRADVVII